MKCQRCNGDFQENSFIPGKRYLEIDLHHSPPQFMTEEDKFWEGDLIPLCRECHVWIHAEIKKIMFKHSNLFNFINQEWWLWKHVFGKPRKECIKEVIKLGEKFK